MTLDTRIDCIHMKSQVVLQLLYVIRLVAWQKQCNICLAEFRHSEHCFAAGMLCLIDMSNDFARQGSNTQL